ncbi:MAG: hypothetical protein GY797_17715 [Deltaproteobacteria bacterium]|nr:hypothetical protein [Deltaproteobacteria bacterium]
MAEGFIEGPMDKEQIDKILVKGEIENPGHGISSLFEWAVPHWEWVENAGIGSVKVSKETAHYIIDRLQKVLPDQKAEVAMSWVNWGWSVNYDLPDWRVRVNFSKLHYKEE